MCVCVFTLLRVLGQVPENEVLLEEELVRCIVILHGKHQSLLTLEAGSDLIPILAVRIQNDISHLPPSHLEMSSHLHLRVHNGGRALVLTLGSVEAREYWEKTGVRGVDIEERACRGHVLKFYILERCR